MSEQTLLPETRIARAESRSEEAHYNAANAKRAARYAMIAAFIAIAIAVLALVER